MYCICCKKNNVTPYNIIDDSLEGKLSEEELIWNKSDKLVEGGIINTIIFP